MNYLTTREMADALGVSVGRVYQLAASRHVAPERLGRVYLWTRRHLEQLRRRPGGRPRKGTGGDGDN